MSEAEGTKPVCKQYVAKPAGPAIESLPALARDDILSRDDLNIVAVPVPEWGGKVYIKTLTGEQRDAFEQACINRRKAKNPDSRGLKAELVIMAATTEDGKLLFARTDMPALLKKSAPALERLYETAAELSGLTESAAKELEGNSEGDTSDDSGLS